MSSSSSASAAVAFSRRTLLGVSAAGLTVLAAGCSSSAADGEQVVTRQEADELSGQVAVQERLVGAFAAVAAADPVLGRTVQELATQASEQLDRLRAAAPANGSAASSAAGSSTAPPGPQARTWLREQVSTAADSHARAALDQTGPRAALLGSIAAGLRGQDGRLS